MARAALLVLGPVVINAFMPQPVQAAAASLDVAALMALLAERKSGEARFTEERHVAALDGPLRSSGTLSFTAPDRFVRRTLEPRPETMEVQGNQLTLKRGGRTRQMALDTVPEAALMVEAIRGTLAGDSRALARHFVLDVGGGPALWTLALKPLDPALARQVLLVQITGQAADVRSVELSMAGGDRSMMSIEPVAAGSRQIEPVAAASPARAAPAPGAAAPK